MDGERLRSEDAGRKRRRDRSPSSPSTSPDPLDVPVAQIDVRRHKPRSSDAKWKWRALRIHDSLNISIVSAVPGVREAERTRGCFGRAGRGRGGGRRENRIEPRGSLDAVEDYNNCDLMPVIGQQSWPIDIALSTGEHLTLHRSAEFARAGKNF